MSKIAVVTDSNSGITQERAKELGIYVLPMPFFIDGELYLEDITLTQEQFYEKLTGDADVSTSQPSPDAVMSLWDDLLKNKGYDEIVHIPMSSGLSSSCATAMMLAQDYDGKVQVVDNQRISVTMKLSVLDAMKMTEDGLSAAVRPRRCGPAASSKVHRSWLRACRVSTRGLYRSFPQDANIVSCLSR